MQVTSYNHFGLFKKLINHELHSYLLYMHLLLCNSTSRYHMSIILLINNPR